MNPKRSIRRASFGYFIPKKNIEFRNCICYNAYRQKDIGVHMAQRKPPSVRDLGAFFLFFGSQASTGRLPLLIPIQPLADVIGDHTSHDRDEKRYWYIHMAHPLSVASLGATTIAVYHKPTNISIITSRPAQYTRCGRIHNTDL